MLLPVYSVAGTIMLLDPDEIVIRRLEQQGDELRSQGDLEGACKTFQHLLSIVPTHLKAERLVSSLSQRRAVLASTPGGLKPAPFVLVPEFLPCLLRDEIYAFMVSKAET